MPLPTPDLSTLTPEQRQSFDADWVRLQSNNPFAGSLPTHYTATIDDIARHGAIAMKQNGYLPNTLTGMDPADILSQAYNAGDGDPQDTNNALALLGMGLTAQFNQSSANRAMEFSAEQAQLNRDWQTSANQTAMNFSAEQAQLNRDWQERMSNTAFQRSMQDMKNAGLNPILAYSQGGAATTSGATASGFTSSGSSASGVSASSSLANFDYNTRRELAVEQTHINKEVALKKMDIAGRFAESVVDGLFSFAKLIPFL